MRPKSPQTICSPTAAANTARTAQVASPSVRLLEATNSNNGVSSNSFQARQHHPHTTNQWCFSALLQCRPLHSPCSKRNLIQATCPTTDTNDKMNWLMDHPHTCPNAIIRFHASDMILKTTVDAAHLVSPKARSRAAAHRAGTTTTVSMAPSTSYARP
jgi:hypothetical protein